MNKSEPSLNSPLIDKLVKDVAAIDTSRDMRSEPNTEQLVRMSDPIRQAMNAGIYLSTHQGQQDAIYKAVETLIAQKVAEAEHKQSQMILKKWQSFPSDGDLQANGEVAYREKYGLN